MKALVICGFLALAGVVGWQQKQLRVLTANMRDTGDAVAESRLAFDYDREMLEKIAARIEEQAEWRSDIESSVADLTDRLQKIPRSMRGIEDQFLRVNGEIEALREESHHPKESTESIFDGIRKRQQEERIQDLESARLRDEMEKSAAERAASLRSIIGR